LHNPVNANDKGKKALQNNRLNAYFYETTNLYTLT
jgi:hypothetical protein